MKFEPKIHQNIGFSKLQMECVKTKKKHLSRWLVSSYKNVRFSAVQGATFPHAIRKQLNISCLA